LTAFKSIVRPLAYDVGANNGDDTAYYLRKGYKVVAIEPNPKLIGDMDVRFQTEIKAGHLILENCAVSNRSGEIDFYTNIGNDVLSTLTAPTKDVKPKWATSKVHCEKLSKIVSRYGYPHLVKIDVEGEDALVVEDLREQKIIPNYISVECHDAYPLLFLGLMGYTKFALVNCAKVGHPVVETRIHTVNKQIRKHKFLPHSSGPIGNDLGTDWCDLDDILMRFSLRHKLQPGGWFDVHAVKD
jgi:FkbM family methyltransferase